MSGSKTHRYQVGRTLSEADLTSFESANGIRLPEDYRQFLAHVGNGGAGPYYGLFPLGTTGRWLAEPFPLTVASDTLTDEELDRLPDRDEYPGILEFCEQGCGIFSYLVVNGSTYGTIWDGREDFFPTGLSFGVWYLNWLEEKLLLVHNEQFVPRLRVGMSYTDVLLEFGGDWKIRTFPNESIRYLRSDYFPATLELNEGDIVVKIIPRTSL